ncbi:MAG: domain S-box-containing protein [Belnapia sp.]|nr:domain S-box-containing protein [Belnapia sp.]
MPKSVLARCLGYGLSGTPSLGGRIVGIVLVIILAMATLAAAALWQAHAAARDQVAAQLVATASALAGVVDREFARAEALLQGLALMPTIQNDDLPGFIETGRIAADLLGLPILTVAGPEGLQRASTQSSTERLARGLPAAPEAMRVFASGHTEIGDFDEGNVPGQRRVVVAVPVLDDPQRAGSARGGPVRYALGLVLPRDRLAQALEEQVLPEGWVATMADRNLTIVARTRDQDSRVGQVFPAPVIAAMGRRAEGLIPDTFNLDGEPIIMAFAVAPRSGYRVAIGATQASFVALRKAALLRLGTVVVPIAVLGVALAVLLASGLAQSLRRLAQPQGTTPDPDQAPILRETAELSRALAAERAARDAAEAALRDRGAWLEAAQRAGDVGVWSWDAASDSARWSDGMASLLGVPGGSVTRAAYRQFRARVLPADRAGLDAAIARLLDRPGEAGDEPPDTAVEFRLRLPDGRLRWLRAQGSLLPGTSDGPDGPRLLLGAFIDITARRALEDDREALLRQQEFLAGEIHHRVKNSLQLVLSLLLLQARRASPEAALQLREAAGRVATVASVHRRLYEDQDVAGGDAGRYMAGLVDDLRQSIADRATGRDLRLVADAGLRPGLERLAPLGMVATELMTNALKYGAGTVTLRLVRVAGEMELSVEDEGPGFPPGFDIHAAHGLGMRVATTLTRQAGGRLLVDCGVAGGRVVLRVPIGQEDDCPDDRPDDRPGDTQRGANQNEPLPLSA